MQLRRCTKKPRRSGKCIGANEPEFSALAPSRRACDESPDGVVPSPSEVEYLINRDQTLHFSFRIASARTTWPPVRFLATNRMFPVVGASIIVGVATALGFLACFVPGFIVAAGLAVVIPAMIVEKAGVFDSLSRSWALTRDYRLSLFGALLLIGLFSIGSSLLAATLLVPGGFMALSAGQTSLTYSLVSFALILVSSALQSVLAGVAYHDLRVFKDGIDEDDLVAVFD